MLLAYAQVNILGYVYYDDVNYVVTNPLVTQFGWEKALDVLGPQFGNFTPLTWVSFILTHQVAGASATAHHLVSLALHVVNIAILFFLAREIFREYDLFHETTLPAFAVALVFAIHPQNVEAVSWIAARKDLLMTFFLLLSVSVYLAGTSRDEPGKQVLAFVLFNLACLSKPTAVSAIVVFFVLRARVLPMNAVALKQYAISLAPFVLAVAGYLLVAYQYQDMASALSYERHGIIDRLVVVLNNVAAYTGRYYSLGPYVALYQTDMAFDVVNLLIVVIMIVVLVVLFLARQLASAVLMILSLALLSPGSGLVQVGIQGGADRFAYMSFIALHMMNVVLVFRASRVLFARRAEIVFAMAVSFVALVLFYKTYVQVPVWKDRQSLWAHAVMHMPDNVSARIQLGYSYIAQQEYSLCKTQFDAAIEAINRKIYLDLDGLLLGAAICHFHTGDVEQAQAFLDALSNKDDVKPAVRARMLEYREKISSSK